MYETNMEALCLTDTEHLAVYICMTNMEHCQEMVVCIYQTWNPA